MKKILAVFGISLLLVSCSNTPTPDPDPEPTADQLIRQKLEGSWLSECSTDSASRDENFVMSATYGETSSTGTFAQTYYTLGSDCAAGQEILTLALSATATTGTVAGETDTSDTPTTFLGANTGFKLNSLATGLSVTILNSVHPIVAGVFCPLCSIAPANCVNDAVVDVTNCIDDINTTFSMSLPHVGESIYQIGLLSADLDTAYFGTRSTPDDQNGRGPLLEESDIYWELTKQ